MTAAEDLLQFFACDHLPEPLRAVSRPFREMAALVVDRLPANAERDQALRKLLEAKDCAVRAALFKPRAEWPRGGGPIPPHWPYQQDGQ